MEPFDPQKIEIRILSSGVPTNAHLGFQSNLADGVDSVRFNFGDGSPEVLLSAEEFNLTGRGLNHIYLEEGTYTATVRVFARYFYSSEYELFDDFIPLNAAYNSTTKRIQAALAPNAFTDHRITAGRYQAVLVIAVIRRAEEFSDGGDVYL